MHHRGAADEMKLLSSFLNYQKVMKKSKGDSISTFFSEIRIEIYAVCMIYLLLSSLFATVNLDTDEFRFIREPYELFGGAYTIGYLKEKEYKNVFKTILKSYYFYWLYRPLNAPIIREEHKRFFSAEEARFGYVNPERAEEGDPSLSNAGRVDRRSR